MTTDNRTGKTFEVPIKNNAVNATAFKQAKIDKPMQGDRPEDGQQSLQSSCFCSSSHQLKRRPLVCACTTPAS